MTNLYDDVAREALHDWLDEREGPDVDAGDNAPTNDELSAPVVSYPCFDPTDTADLPF